MLNPPPNNESNNYGEVSSEGTDSPCADATPEPLSIVLVLNLFILKLLALHLKPS
jgi:hypothetical protein